ncbi:hypothetical Protein YC6258_02764 [Gynuella sunshinyii YC6258]|uniref:Uncharacterized protein n=1 Tax=Gynuella sunshinyii YC6258 TaxID=1445510 RepID=A0A0C5VJJ0_9GAMM|nr:hypothetical Protein YC6258_02764 [Gynuella sunshinyii YC6258]
MFLKKYLAFCKAKGDRFISSDQMISDRLIDLEKTRFYQK